jgi:NAD(P)-dependent dehydrogenase (short-subunit alcohol dehydrogenase family)
VNAAATPGAALVTGAARRIGRAVALDLAREGWRIAVHCHRSESDARSVVAEIERAGGKATVLRADLTRDDQARDLVPRAAAALGPVRCLVNNASVFDGDTVETATRESWDAHIETNLRAPFVLIQSFSRELPEGVKGNIVNVLDERVWNLTPYFVSYTVSKAGLWALTRTMALALAPRIRVNAVGPGPTLPSPRQSKAEFERQCRRMPLGRGTTPEEIGAAVRFILDSPAMTGQMIALDGGQHLGWSHPEADRLPDIE